MARSETTETDETETEIEIETGMIKTMMMITMAEEEEIGEAITGGGSLGITIVTIKEEIGEEDIRRIDMMMRKMKSNMKTLMKVTNKLIKMIKVIRI